MQHQHLADRFRGDETDETSAAVDHGDGGSGFFLQHAECLVEAAAVADGRYGGGHCVGDAGIGTQLLERADEIPAPEQTHRLARPLPYRGFALAPSPPPPPPPLP